MATASLIFPTGASSDLFKDYKPSTNAHTDFLSASGTAPVKGVTTVRLALRGKLRKSHLEQGSMELTYLSTALTVHVERPIIDTTPLDPPDLIW